VGKPLGSDVGNVNGGGRVSPGPASTTGAASEAGRGPVVDVGFGSVAGVVDRVAGMSAGIDSSGALPAAVGVGVTDGVSATGGVGAAAATGGASR
jgi:hypothetical protein